MTVTSPAHRSPDPGARGAGRRARGRPASEAARGRLHEGPRRAGRPQLAGQARPAGRRPQPGHVRRRGRQRHDHHRLHRGPHGQRPERPVRRPGLRLAVVHRPLRQLRRRPWPRAAARPRPTRCARPGPRPSPTCEVDRRRRAEAAASELRKGDVVVVSAGETIPGDGDVIEGIASVDESAITGESAPVIRESGGDRSAVTGGTRVLSDQIVVRITSDPGQTFLDRMIALVEGAERQKTPNEIALNILLAGLTIIFLIVVRHAASRSPLYSDAAVSRRRCSSPCSSASSRPPSAACSPPSASPAWTAWCGTTCSPCPAAPWRRPATSTRCCSTRPGTITLGQPAGRGVPPDARRHRGGARRRGPAGVARRRDARGPLHRRAGQGVRPARPAHRPATRPRSWSSPRRRA